ncbi:MAG: hypothetical protein ACK5N0_11125 [Synechococcaceae cyanobacterium]
MANASGTMNLTSAYSQQLARALACLQQILEAASHRSDWDAIGEACFGQAIPPPQLQRLLGTLPRIDVRSAGELGTGLGGTAANPEWIVLDERLFSATLGWSGDLTPSLAMRVLLEEIGHLIDQRLNAVDTPGEEGALFAELLLATEGSLRRGDGLQARDEQDDSAVVDLDGQRVHLELAVTPPSIPVISLAVSPEVVSEDGPRQLIYSFTRTGTLDSSLTVNFNVAGSASYGSDYSQRGAASYTASGGSITFVAGSSMALLNLVPSTDDQAEADETIALSLTPGNGYLAASTAATTGTILDNDQPARLVRAPIAASRPLDSQFEVGILYAFAALKSDGSVVTWGDPLYGGDSRAVASFLRSGVNQIFATCAAFAALKSDGSVITWGYSGSGGDSSAVASHLSSGVRQIFSNAFAFVALKNDGSVVTWGNSMYGGDSSAVASRLSSGVTQIFSGPQAFAALKSDGSVVTWGYSWGGAAGDSSAVSSRLSSGVSQIFSTFNSFAALKNDGSVVTWGTAGFGGDSSNVAHRLSSGVSQIFSTNTGYAALKGDGSVVTWGESSNVFDVAENLLSSGVKTISSSFGAFAALKNDGSVVTWGSSMYGGNSGAVASRLRFGVNQVFSSFAAFAALKADGSVVTWGDPFYGGDSRSVASRLSSGVTQIFATRSAFAALKSDGSVVTWGNEGGDSRTVASQLSSGVHQIFSNYGAFAALKTDGSVVTWGYPLYGGDSSSVSSRLSSGVVGFANPLMDDRLSPGTYAMGPVTIEGVNLGSTSLGYALLSGTGTPIQVTYHGGNASTSNPGKDWSSVAASPTSTGYALYWRNTATQKVARWNLNPSGAYESGYYLSGNLLLSEEANLNIDLNGDDYVAGSTTIQSLNLGSTSRGYALKPGSATPIQVSFDNGNFATASSLGSDWSPVAAAPAESGYTLYWRHNASQQVERWSLDARGARTTSALLADAQLSSAEATLNLDLNGDGIIAVGLTSTAEGYALLRTGQPPLQVTDLGGHNTSESNPGHGWTATATAAAADGSGFHLYWNNNLTHDVLRWNIDATGAERGVTLLPPTEVVFDEVNLQRDLNGDGFIAGTSTLQGVNLGRTAQGYALQSVIEARGGRSVPVRWASGHTSAASPGNGWTATAAVPAVTGDSLAESFIRSMGYPPYDVPITLYWSNDATQQAARWSLDASGAYQSGSFLSNDQLYSEETSLNADLNGDAIIGAAFSTIESHGKTTLLRRNDGKAYVQVGSDRVAVVSPFNFGTEDPCGEWQMLAAESVGGQNQILWRNNPANFLHVWSLDASWNWQSSAGTINPLSAAALGLESNFQLDLDGNGLIG